MTISNTLECVVKRQVAINTRMGWTLESMNWLVDSLERFRLMTKILFIYSNAHLSLTKWHYLRKIFIADKMLSKEKLFILKYTRLKPTRFIGSSHLTNRICHLWKFCSKVFILSSSKVANHPKKKRTNQNMTIWNSFLTLFCLVFLINANIFFQPHHHYYPTWRFTCKV